MKTNQKNLLKGIMVAGALLSDHLSASGNRQCAIHGPVTSYGTLAGDAGRTTCNAFRPYNQFIHRNENGD